MRKSCNQVDSLFLILDIWSAFQELYKCQQKGIALTVDVSCSYCEESIIDQTDHIVTFFCHHIFHSDCIHAQIVATNLNSLRTNHEKDMKVILDSGIRNMYQRGLYSRKPHHDANRRHSTTTTSTDQVFWFDTLKRTCPLC